MERWVEQTRDLVTTKGAEALTVDDLGRDDLDGLVAWAGGPLHVEQVRRALERVEAGDAEYLCVRAPAGRAVAKGGLDLRETLPKIWQVTTHPRLRGLGIGTHLVGALERRAQERGHQAVGLGVEVSNPRALALYERLGYEAYGQEQSGWEQQRPDGTTHWYEADLILMRKPLGIRRRRP